MHCLKVMLRIHKFLAILSDTHVNTHYSHLCRATRMMAGGIPGGNVGGMM